jgi:signal transduction histidine kinase
VQIAVHDDGPGIPLELQETIFDRFAQARATDSRTGTGLGLTFCKLVGHLARE